MQTKKNYSNSAIRRKRKYDSDNFFVDYFFKGSDVRYRKTFKTFNGYRKFRRKVYEDKKLILGIHGML